MDGDLSLAPLLKPRRAQLCRTSYKFEYLGKNCPKRDEIQTEGQSVLDPPFLANRKQEVKEEGIYLGVSEQLPANGHTSDGPTDRAELDSIFVHLSFYALSLQLSARRRRPFI